MTPDTPPPSRNWAGVLILLVGGGGLVFTALHAPLQNNSVIGSILNILILLFAHFPGMIAVLVAAFALAFGTGRLASVVGNSRLGRTSIVAWAVLGAASQCAFLGYLTDDADSFARAQDVQVTLSIATVLVGLVAGVLIARAAVVAPVARAGMFASVLGFAITEVLLIAYPTDASGYWSLPRLAGLMLLGLAFWRAGLSTPKPIPVRPKSLAE